MILGVERKRFSGWYSWDKAITDEVDSNITKKLKGAFDKIWGSQSHFHDRERAKKSLSEWSRAC